MNPTGHTFPPPPQSIPETPPYFHPVPSKQRDNRTDFFLYAYTHNMSLLPPLNSSPASWSPNGKENRSPCLRRPFYPVASPQTGKRRTRKKRKVKIWIPQHLLNAPVLPPTSPLPPPNPQSPLKSSHTPPSPPSPTALPSTAPAPSSSIPSLRAARHCLRCLGLSVCWSRWWS